MVPRNSTSEYFEYCFLVVVLLYRVGIFMQYMQYHTGEGSAWRSPTFTLIAVLLEPNDRVPSLNVRDTGWLGARMDRGSDPHETHCIGSTARSAGR